MKSWRTTIGGSLETLGGSIRDLCTLNALVDAGKGDLRTLNLWLILSGSIICMIGKFFKGLFAADNAEVERRLDDHAQQLAQVKGDTTQLTREVRGN